MAVEKYITKFSDSAGNTGLKVRIHRSNVRVQKDFMYHLNGGAAQSRARAVRFRNKILRENGMTLNDSQLVPGAGVYFIADRPDRNAHFRVTIGGKQIGNVYIKDHGGKGKAKAAAFAIRRKAERERASAA
jgi:hypothetical protein